MIEAYSLDSFVLLLDLEFASSDRVVLFQWDAEKSEINFMKHGVLFEEAATVFFDDRMVEFFDILHSQFEDRFWAIGKSDIGRILLVVYSWRRSSVEKKAYYRIISARVVKKAKELKFYDEGS